MQLGLYQNRLPTLEGDLSFPPFFMAHVAHGHLCHPPWVRRWTVTGTSSKRPRPRKTWPKVFWTLLSEQCPVVPGDLSTWRGRYRPPNRDETGTVKIFLPAKYGGEKKRRGWVGYSTYSRYRYSVVLECMSFIIEGRSDGGSHPKTNSLF